MVKKLKMHWFKTSSIVKFKTAQALCMDKVDKAYTAEALEHIDISNKKRRRKSLTRLIDLSRMRQRSSIRSSGYSSFSASS